MCGVFFLPFCFMFLNITIFGEGEVFWTNFTHISQIRPNRTKTLQLDNNILYAICEFQNQVGFPSFCSIPLCLNFMLISIYSNVSNRVTFRNLDIVRRCISWFETCLQCPLQLFTTTPPPSLGLPFNSFVGSAIIIQSLLGHSV